MLNNFNSLQWGSGLASCDKLNICSWNNVLWIILYHNATLLYRHPVHFSLFLDTQDSSSFKVNLGISVFCPILVWQETLITQSICPLRYSFHFIVETTVPSWKSKLLYPFAVKYFLNIFGRLLSLRNSSKIIIQEWHVWH